MTLKEFIASLANRTRIQMLCPISYTPAQLGLKMEGVVTPTSGNTLAALGWQGVAAKPLKKAEALLPNLENFVTDFTDEVVKFPQDSPLQLTISVPLGVGSSSKNLKDWNKSGISRETRTLTLNRYSLPFGVTSYDTVSLEELEEYIRLSIEAITKDFLAEMYALMAAESGIKTVEVTRTNFNQGYVNQELSWLIEPSVTELAVTPKFYGKLLKTDDNDLPLNQLAVDHIERIESPTALGATAFGYMAYRTGLVFASRQPYIPTGQGQIFVTSLGKVRGIEFWLKQWMIPGSETIMHSVEAGLGVAIGKKESLVILKEKAETPASE